MNGVSGDPKALYQRYESTAKLLAKLFSSDDEAKERTDKSSYSKADKPKVALAGGGSSGCSMLTIGSRQVNTLGIVGLLTLLFGPTVKASSEGRQTRDTIECTTTYFGDTGYGGVMGSRASSSCGTVSRATAVRTSGVRNFDYAKYAANSYYYTPYGMTGYGGNIVSNISREWAE